MRCSHIVGFSLVLTSLLVPQHLAGQERPANYFVLRGGSFIPTGDLESFNPSVELELFYGRYLQRNFALEAGVTLFRAEGEETTSSSSELVGFALLLTPKGVYPTGKVDLVGGLGLGVYFPGVNVQVAGGPDFEGDDAVIGLHALLGVDLNFTRLWYVGLEGKYLGTTEAKFFEEEDAGLNISGFTITLSLGLRF